MTCRRSLEYLAAALAVAVSIALLAFAISATHFKREQAKPGPSENKRGNITETQLLIGTTDVPLMPPTTTQSPSLLSSSSPSSPSETPPQPPSIVTTLMPPVMVHNITTSTAKNLLIDLTTVSPAVTPVTSNSIVHIDNDDWDSFEYAIVSTTSASALDPSTIEKDTHVVVNTSLGKIRGRFQKFRSGERGGYYSFKGIRYGQAPVGDR
uniref:Carboxylesterase type B domain-containing protein n=1 Tax=Musca domestica TaxID=7370 RepID=A0A1I8NKQ9_MUSDO